MKMSSLKTWAAAIAIALIAAPAYALTINDPGVVGAASGETGSGGAVARALEISNHLLAMAANTADPAACDLNGDAACYRTSTTEYTGSVSGGTEVTGGGVGGFDGYVYVLAKYDGPGAGYVLFHIPTLLAAGGTIPLLPASIWGNTNDTGLALSHYVGFGTRSVPDGGATLSLLGLALAGIGAFRRFANKA
jgi:hypothetical protein